MINSTKLVWKQTSSRLRNNRIPKNFRLRRADMAVSLVELPKAGMKTDPIIPSASTNGMKYDRNIIILQTPLPSGPSRTPWTLVPPSESIWIQLRSASQTKTLLYCFAFHSVNLKLSGYTEATAHSGNFWTWGILFAKSQHATACKTGPSNCMLFFVVDFCQIFRLFRAKNNQRAPTRTDMDFALCDHVSLPTQNH